MSFYPIGTNLVRILHTANLFIASKWLLLENPFLRSLTRIMKMEAIIYCYRSYNFFLYPRNFDALPDHEHRVTGLQGSELMVHRVHEPFAYESSTPDVHVRHHEVQSRCEVVTPFNTEARVNVLAARASVPFVRRRIVSKFPKILLPALTH